MNTIQNQKFLTCLYFFGLLLTIALCSEAHASVGSGGGLPYETPLTNLRNSVTGPVAFTVSLIGIIGSFAALIFGGEMNGFLKTLVFIVLLVAVLVGANNLMSGLFGTGAVIASLNPIAPITALS